MSKNANVVTIAINGETFDGTLDELFARITGRISPEKPSTAAVAPEKQPEKTPEKPKNAPKHLRTPEKPQPKPTKKAAPQPAGEWWEPIVAQPWVKEWKTSPASTIVKVRPEAGHGPELRAQGFRTMKNKQWWWVEKDAALAAAKGKKYLANKAAREGKVA